VLCLFVPVGGKSMQVAAVQVHFKGGAVRSYLMTYQPARGKHHAPPPLVASFAEAGIGGGLDLRDADQVSELETALKGWKPDTATR
jgi:hypothetical protein